MGLPVIRTSVDHGPAFDIAGRDLARAASLYQALRLAAARGPAWPGVGAPANPSVRCLRRGMTSSVRYPVCGGPLPSAAATPGVH